MQHCGAGICLKFRVKCGKLRHHQERIALSGYATNRLAESTVVRGCRTTPADVGNQVVPNKKSERQSPFLDGAGFFIATSPDAKNKNRINENQQI